MARPLSGTTDVGTAGTAVQISNTPRRLLAITFKAEATNAGDVWVGDSAVAANGGFPLEPGDAVSYDFGAYGVSCPISDFYVDAETNGDDCHWTAIMWT